MSGFAQAKRAAAVSQDRRRRVLRITSYNVCYTKLLRLALLLADLPDACLSDPSLAATVYRRFQSLDEAAKTLLIDRLGRADPQATAILASRPGCVDGFAKSLRASSGKSHAKGAKSLASTSGCAFRISGTRRARSCSDGTSRNNFV